MALLVGGSGVTIDAKTWRLAARVIAMAVALWPAGAWSSSPLPAPPAPRDYRSLPLDAKGQLPTIPYVWERRVGRKHLVVIGTRHSNDPDAPMHARIDAILDRVRPQLVLHESTAPAALAELPRENAIRVGADVGAAAVAARRVGARFVSGDAAVADEVAALLRDFSPREVFVFMVAQRHIGNVPTPNLTEAAAGYPAFFREYLAPAGLPAPPAWATWNGFLHEYRAVFGAPLTAAGWDPSSFSAIRTDGRLSGISRATNRVRDDALRAAIEDGLRRHDRVAVVFGGWHVLALEPTLPSLLPAAVSTPPPAASRASPPAR